MNVSTAIPIIPTNVWRPVIYPRFYFVEYWLTKYKLAVRRPLIPTPNTDRLKYVVNDSIYEEKFIEKLPTKAKPSIMHIKLRRLNYIYKKIDTFFL